MEGSYFADIARIPGARDGYRLAYDVSSNAFPRDTRVQARARLIYSAPIGQSAWRYYRTTSARRIFDTSPSRPP